MRRHSRTFYCSTTYSKYEGSYQHNAPSVRRQTGASSQKLSSPAGEMRPTMPTQKKYRFFLGANSPEGFVSFFDHLIDLDAANEVYIIKGGPGVGKSSFMKRAAAGLVEAGLTAEWIVCSADPDSLDGVVFPEIGVAFVDGTQPHAAVTYRKKSKGPSDQYLLHSRRDVLPFHKNCIHQSCRRFTHEVVIGIPKVQA